MHFWLPHLHIAYSSICVKIHNNTPNVQAAWASASLLKTFFHNTSPRQRNP